ncbi:MAG: TIR domain-containing protein [Flavobacteriaceae bacterium]
MQKRNYFMSYHHSSDYHYLVKLREKFKNKTFSDYGFKDEDLGEASKSMISKKIQSRIWSSSITIVLVGENTGDSDWIDWEIWYSLRELQGTKVSRRKFNPKGILAIFLPTEKHNVPKRLQENLDSKYAKKIYWDELDDLFDDVIQEVYQNRKNTHLIRNNLTTRKNTTNYLVLVRRFFSSLFGTKGKITS